MANLLLIDDDPDLLPDQMRQVFPAPAHRVEIAPTGSEGLGRARDGRPDVILLDLRLPDQSGLDVLRQLRQIDARIPVVLVTVVRSADSAIEAMRQGAYDYLLDVHDREMLKWVKLFNPYDLYSKSPVPPDWKQLRPYYEDLVAKFIPATIRF